MMLIAERKEIKGRFFCRVEINLPVNYEYFATPYPPYEGRLYFKDGKVKTVKSDKKNEEIIKLVLQHQQKLNKQKNN
jgi:hypothetical protein